MLHRGGLCIWAAQCRLNCAQRRHNLCAQPCAQVHCVDWTACSQRDICPCVRCTICLCVPFRSRLQGYTSIVWGRPSGGGLLSPQPLPMLVQRTPKLGLADTRNPAAAPAFAINPCHQRRKYTDPGSLTLPTQGARQVPPPEGVT